VVTTTEAIFTPLDVVREFGFTVHFVRLAGTVQERFTIEEKPKNGVTAMSLMYCAVPPATTVCDVIPRFATEKSATRFRATAVEFDAV
jgi:hypothetical protein